MALVGEHQPLTRGRGQAGGFVQQLGDLAWAGCNSLGGQVAWLGMAQHHLRHFCKQRGNQGSTLNLIQSGVIVAAAMTLEALRSSAALPKYLEVSKKDRDQFGIGNEGSM